jgi:hypothetical protein
MMKIYKEGDRSKGPCKKCKKLVMTTFRLSTVPMSASDVIVHNVLAAICDQCNHVVAVPHQSMPRIKEALEIKKKPIEVRVPRHLLDILLLACDQFQMGHSTALVPALIRFYISMANTKPRLSNIKKLSHSEFAKGSGSRLSLKISEPLYQQFEESMKTTGLSKTEFFRGLILQINEEILQGPQDKWMEKVEKVMLIAA